MLWLKSKTTFKTSSSKARWSPDWYSIPLTDNSLKHGNKTWPKQSTGHPLRSVLGKHDNASLPGCRVPGRKRSVGTGLVFASKYQKPLFFLNKLLVSLIIIYKLRMSNPKNYEGVVTFPSPIKWKILRLRKTRFSLLTIRAHDVLSLFANTPVDLTL